MPRNKVLKIEDEVFLTEQKLVSKNVNRLGHELLSNDFVHLWQVQWPQMNKITLETKLAFLINNEKGSKSTCYLLSAPLISLS